MYFCTPVNVLPLFWSILTKGVQRLFEITRFETECIYAKNKNVAIAF